MSASKPTSEGLDHRPAPGNGRAETAPADQTGRAAGRAALLVYLRYTLLAALLVGAAAGAQIVVVFQRFEPSYVLIPAFLTLLIGGLAGRNALLRERLRRKGAQFRAVADFAQEFTYLRTVDGRYEYVSPSCRQLTGYGPEEFYAIPNLMDRLVHSEDCERWASHVHSVNNAGMPVSLDIRLITRDGRMVWISHLCAPVYDEQGRQVAVRSTNLDITERKAFEERIERMAYYDALTGLPNRHALIREMHARIASVSTAGPGFAVLFLDLDWFKHINDSFGHALGDELLRQVASRLRDGNPEPVLISRFGGDEFVIVVPDVAQPEAAVSVARDLLTRIERPFTVAGREFYVSGSIGIALYPYDGRDPDLLVRHADSAMYESKKDRQSSIRLYSPELARSMTAFISVENRLRKGLRDKQFVVHYQPKIRLADAAVIGLEALVRWNDPERGLLLPGEFIAVAEETGLIKPLGECILQQVCRQLHEYQTRGIGLPIAVNVSGRQFADADFCGTLVAVAASAGCALERLEVEVTEQVLLGDIDEAARKLGRLRDLGVKVALDDFGSGYCSLGYLKRLPIDQVKVDRSFVHDLTRHPRDQAILRAVVALCRDLDLDLVAEGIETREQQQLLEALGCRLGQGFLFGRAAPPEQIEAMILPNPGAGRAAIRRALFAAPEPAPR